MLSSCGPPSRLAPAAYPLSLRRRNAVRSRSASEGFCHRPSLVNSITNFPAWQEGSGRCSEIFYLFATGNLGKSPEVRPSRSGLSANRLFPAQDGGIRQKGAAGGRQTYFCARLRRNNFPHNNTRVPRRSAFWPKPQKAPKALFNPPAPKRATLLREGMFRASRETPTESAVRRFLSACRKTGWQIAGCTNAA